MGIVGMGIVDWYGIWHSLRVSVVWTWIFPFVIVVVNFVLYHSIDIDWTGKMVNGIGYQTVMEMQ